MERHNVSFIKVQFIEEWVCIQMHTHHIPKHTPSTRYTHKNIPDIPQTKTHYTVQIHQSTKSVSKDSKLISPLLIMCHIIPRTASRSLPYITYHILPRTASRSLPSSLCVMFFQGQQVDLSPTLCVIFFQGQRVDLSPPHYVSCSSKDSK